MKVAGRSKGPGPLDRAGGKNTIVQISRRYGATPWAKGNGPSCCDLALDEGSQGTEGPGKAETANPEIP